MSETTTKPKILIVDPVHPHAIERLSEKCEVQHIIHPPKEELIRLLQDTDVIVLRSGIDLPADVIKSSSKLKVIARAGSGVDNIDIPAATENGTMVFNVPAETTRSVAELTFGLLLTLMRKLKQADKWLKNNQWKKSALSGYELTGKTLGIVGLGKIGLEVADISKGFRMNILGFKKNITEEIKNEMEQKGITLVSSLAEVLEKSDIISINVPLNDSTRDMIRLKEFQMMKDGAFLVNTSRGGVVNEIDLYNALNQDMIKGAATDVFERDRELLSPLFELDNVVVTPHIGAMTDDSQKRIAEILSNYIFEELDGKDPKTRLN